MSALDLLLAYADTYGPVIPLAFILLLFRRKQMPRVLIILSWYLLISIVIFGISNYMANRFMNNLFLYHLFCIIELCFVCLLFKEMIRSEKVRRTIPYFLALATLLFILNSVFLEKINSWNSNSASVEFLIIICFSLIYYFELAGSNDILFFSKNAFFWIVSGLFVYCSGCSVLFAFYKYTAQNNIRFTLDFWIFQILMYLIKNLLITKGILCFKARK